ncbi:MULTISPECIES: bifunctional tetrahydrofolate synthase/dihydrofolate synthase [unclassified Acinetobacter]|uniref:bifunctional tetrahydrofolate synthase/dihydrofolate synthase n=1 Tax=unclassified Acinetobacter TaxID=196816 RepID=UPI0035BA3D02
MTWLNYWGSIHVSAIDLGLERVQPVAEYLQLLKPNAKIITVAGTNGKGSTTATIAKILQCANYHVGLYQSPHLFKFNERVMINGEAANDNDLIQAFVEVEQARIACNLTLSFFEATTLAAFLLFKQKACDVWVLEVGLGGRLDVVNLLDADLAVITNIGLDHVDWLGDTIEKVAFEKAGIIRDGIPVIFAGEQDLPQAIADKIEQHQAKLYQLNQDYFFEQQPDSLTIATPALTLNLPKGKLAAINQAAAVMAVLNSDLNVSQQAIADGIRGTQLIGRFQMLEYQGRTLLLDVAHNPHGVDFLLKQLAHYRQQHAQFKNVVAVFSMLADKDIQQVTNSLAKDVKKWYISPLNVARAASLAQLQHALVNQDVTISDSVLQSLNLAIAQTSKQDLILICGSFHTLEEIWEHLHHGNE